ncbi:MAG: sialidase family protein, partial [Terriglobia bacterium]
MTRPGQFAPAPERPAVTSRQNTWIAAFQMRIVSLSLFLALILPTPSWAQRPPGVVIDHQAASTGEYIGSPSIVILPDGAYVSSHDLFGPKSTESVSGVTRIFRSADRGRSWRKVAEVRDQFWSNLFVLHDKLYLMGTSCEYGRIVMRRSLDGGLTWSPPNYLTRRAGYHTAPVPVVVKNERLWRAMEYHPPGPWGHFQAFVISAPVDADLLDGKSWRMASRLPYPPSETEGNTWLEGNAVIGPHGSVLDILRVNNIE